MRFIRSAKLSPLRYANGMMTPPPCVNSKRNWAKLDYTYGIHDNLAMSSLIANDVCIHLRYRRHPRTRRATTKARRASGGVDTSGLHSAYHRLITHTNPVVLALHTTAHEIDACVGACDSVRVSCSNACTRRRTTFTRFNPDNAMHTTRPSRPCARH